MFENLLFQDRAVYQLKDALRQNSLAPALLFHGPAASGKLTLALELARVLTCKAPQKGVWGCQCESCRFHYFLDSPNVILTGYKDFQGEINLSAAALSKTPQSKPQKFHFYRALKKLLKRLDAEFWDTSDLKYRSLSGPGEELAELIAEIHPNLPEESYSLKNLPKILKLAEKIVSLLPEQGVNVEGIRKITDWVRSTRALGYRVVIIEHSDRLLPASRNALLKILEEPPEQVVFILTTRHRSSIIATISSRLRALELIQRTEEQMAEISRKIFLMEKVTVPLHISLQGSGELEQLTQFTDHFWSSAKSHQALPLGWEIKEVDLHAFLDQLTSKITAEMRESGMEKWSKLRAVLDSVNHVVYARDVFHQEQVTVLDRLYLSLREAL